MTPGCLSKLWITALNAIFLNVTQKSHNFNILYSIRFHCGMKNICGVGIEVKRLSWYDLSFSSGLWKPQKRTHGQTEHTTHFWQDKVLPYLSCVEMLPVWTKNRVKSWICLVQFEEQINTVWWESHTWDSEVVIFNVWSVWRGGKGGRHEKLSRSLTWVKPQLLQQSYSMFFSQLEHGEYVEMPHSH